MLFVHILALVGMWVYDTVKFKLNVIKMDNDPMCPIKSDRWIRLNGLIK